MRTRLSICRRKRRFGSQAEARLAAEQDALALHPYRCDRCHHYHLTSRAKGKWVPKGQESQAAGKIRSINQAKSIDPVD